MYVPLSQELADQIERAALIDGYSNPGDWARDILLGHAALATGEAARDLVREPHTEADDAVP